MDVHDIASVCRVGVNIHNPSIPDFTKIGFHSLCLIVVTIGWQETYYQIPEETDDGVVTVCFNVTGQLVRNIILTTTTVDITASGELMSTFKYMYIHTL